MSELDFETPPTHHFFPLLFAFYAELVVVPVSCQLALGSAPHHQEYFPGE
jgi:hypothetical protein